MALSCLKHDKGFTLIEVLISMIMVFVVSVAVFHGYRTALDASARATAAMHRASSQTLLQEKVIAAMHAGQRDGEVSVAGLRYHWQATKQDSKETTLGFDPESLSLRYTGRYVSRIRVEIKTSFNDELLSFNVYAPGG